VVWRTATVPAFLLATPAPEITPAAEGPPAQGGGAPLILPTASNLDPNNIPPLLYYTQAGDTLPALAVRYGVPAEEITSPNPFPQTNLIDPNHLLLIPDRLGGTTPGVRLLPDSEFVYSPSAITFETEAFILEAGGYLTEYEEYLATTGMTSGAEVIERVAIENSINPRLLLALLEYESHWVYGQIDELNLAQRTYPMGLIDKDRESLYRQLVWTVKHLSIGYYGWREGLLTDLTFADGATARLAPDLNAGTVALQYYFSQQRDSSTWPLALSVESGFPALFQEMFGNPWMRAQTVEPLYPPDLSQPPLILPFLVGQLWAFSGGPHGAWELDGARAALDFAPASMESGCVESFQRVLAAAPGLITRADHGVVVIDMDGDGYEQTGWGLLYLHVSTNGNSRPAPVGNWVDKGDFIGYPSCEGGRATGTHIHIARKFNGEWIPADGPLPFNLGGWVAHAGWKAYEGTLTRDTKTVKANPLGTFETNIIRGENDP
jgi:murein DD-endopeptidase MepM/ murein hydrolase activator NlpD